MLKMSNIASSDRACVSGILYENRISQLKKLPARNELRGNIWPVAGSMARTPLREPPRPADALNGLPVFAWTIVENCSCFQTWNVPPRVPRCRTSLGVGPQSSSQFRFVRSEGLLPKSFARFIALVQA